MVAGTRPTATCPPRSRLPLFFQKANRRVQRWKFPGLQE
jgi:hypothetical protein